MSPIVIGFIAGAVAAVLFAVKAVVVKLAYPLGVDAATLLALRMGFSLPVYAVIAWREERQSAARLTTRQIALLAGLGALGYYVAALLDFLGLQDIGASLERTVLYAYPALVVLLTCAINRRAPSVRSAVAVLAVLLGIALTTGAHAATEAQVEPGAQIARGVTLVAISAACFAVFTVSASRLIAEVGANRFTAVSMSAAAVINLALFTLFDHPAKLFTQPPAVYGYALLLAIFCTVVPSFLFSACVRRIGPERSSVLGAIGPVGTVLLAWPLLGEQPTWIQALGMSITIGAGVVMGGKKG